jgi:integrase
VAAVRKPKKHVAVDGTESWKVRYRTATGADSSVTFYDESIADEFAGVMKAIGVARALDWLDKLQAGDERAHALTVDELFEKWIDWKGARNKKGELYRVRSERTIKDYRRDYRKRIAPSFGKMPANLVPPPDVQAWVDDLGGDIAPKTIAGYHSLLHGIYLWGIHPSRGLVINDPCTDTELPTRRKKKPKGLRPDEWQILHQAAHLVDADAADLLLFLVSTGWRWSEAVAVQQMAVDHWTDDDGRSHTYVTMGRVLRREGDHFVFVDDAKSTAGERRVRIVGPAEVMVLRRIAGKKPTDLILTTARGGRWDYTHFYNRVWKRPAKGDDAPGKKRILEEAARLGLDRPDLTLHWLRHTHVGMLILAGEPLTAIQRRLGHASIKTTSDTYGRMIEDASESGLDKVAALLGGAPTRPGIAGSDG